MASMPVGSPTNEIRKDQVQTTEGNQAAPALSEDAACSLVWQNYQKAKDFLENNSWLLEWQESDILYQSPIPNRTTRMETGRPARVPRFLVSKFTRTLARSVKRALFAEQVPFMLRPRGKATQDQADAWTALLSVLLDRMGFVYNTGLQINCQTLQGTGLGKYGWEERQVIKYGRRRKTPSAKVEMPDGQTKEIDTQASDDFEDFEDTVTESWPFYEYRRLGTTLFDPKWCTPDKPKESAGYCIDIDYVNFADLQEMRQLDCYDIPAEEILKAYFFASSNGSATAPAGTQVEDSMSAQGSMVTHAEGRNRQTDANPLAQPLLMLEQWDERSVKTVLVYDGHKLTIRNEEHKLGSMGHTSCTWWPIDNSGYGMGIGKINGGDQRINQGVLNECLKMIAYPFNAPLIVGRGDNAPTQNVINRLGGFWQVDAPGGDVNKAVGFLKMPEVPQEAWAMLDLSQKGGEDVSGANSQMAQGNLGGPGSSAARTATGASRIAAMTDQNVADPVDSVSEGIIIPVVKFLIHMIKTKMPLKEIRDILSVDHAAIIEKAIAQEQFLAAEFDVAVLAGQKLAARQGIQQLIPFFLQIVQQPQLLEYLHQRGETVDFTVIMDLLLQVGELQNQPDIFRKLTPEEKAMLQQMNPGAQKVAAAVALEKLKGQNKKEQIQEQGEVDMANKATELALEKTSEGIPLALSEARVTRKTDADVLQNGLPDAMQQ